MPTATVLGAGISGLLAARALRDAGWTVIVLDQGRGVGGRLATRRIGGVPFDSGGQFLSVREARFGDLVTAWAAAGVLAEWSRGFLTRDGGVADDGHPRYRAVGGMARLAKHLASGLEVRLETTVTAIHSSDTLVTVRAEDGLWRSDALIATAPVPETLALLAAGGTELAPELRRRLEAVSYAPCLCLLLDYPEAAAPALPAPGGLRRDGDRIAWIASQRRKGLRETGEGLVVHAGSGWSAEHFEAPAEVLIGRLLPDLAAILAPFATGDWLKPMAADLKRWRYSLAATTLVEPCLAVDAAARVILAGDAFGARPRIEGAALSGLAAAELLVARGA